MFVPSSRLFRLADGRSLEFAEYGHPEGAPVLFFHGFIGSYHQAAFVHESSRRRGLRLLAVNRPGVGRSSPKQREVIRECAEDARQLLDGLHLPRVLLVGVSGGAPYALACLASMPGRISGTLLLSGLGPVGEPDVLGRMGAIARHALRFGRSMPWMTRLALTLRTRGFRQDPEAFLNGLIRTWSTPDKELFCDPAVRSLFMADIRQVLVDGEGPTNLANELGLYFRWGFRLSDLPPGVPMQLWHGRDDHLVPVAMSEHIAARVPGAVLQVRAGGHFMAVSNSEEIMTRATSILRVAA